MNAFHRARGPLCLVLSLLILARAGSPTSSAAEAEDGLEAASGLSVLDPSAYDGGEILVLYQDGSCETVTCPDTAALEELFRIPVPDWMTVRARLSHNSNPLYDTNYFSVYDETDGALSFDSDSVFAPDGWMYFVFDVRREGTRELLDGSQLPGGNWGVWRMRCTPQTDRC